MCLPRSRTAQNDRRKENGTPTYADQERRRLLDSACYTQERAAYWVAELECVGQPFWDSVAGSVRPIQQDSHIGLQASYDGLQGGDCCEQPIMFALVALAIFLGPFVGLGLSLADFAPEGPELHPPIHS